SSLIRRYQKEVDRESAYEILNAKIERAQEEEEQEKKRSQQKLEREVITGSRRRSARKKETSLVEELSKNTMVRQLGRTVARELTRGLLGVLGVKKRR
ncbi:MAG: helicase HerA-like domain-containing protein, partial [Bacteroidota bacterium]